MCNKTINPTHAVVIKAVQKLVVAKDSFTAVTVRNSLPKTSRVTLPQIGVALSKMFSRGDMGQGYSCICIFNAQGKKVFKLYGYSVQSFEENEGNFLRYNNPTTSSTESSKHIEEEEYCSCASPDWEDNSGVCFICGKKDQPENPIAGAAHAMGVGENELEYNEEDVTEINLDDKYSEVVVVLKASRCTCTSTFGSKEVCTRCYALARVHPDLISEIAKEVLNLNQKED
jgi:hypothetical protein